jgi:hypothetical protein
MKIKNPFSKNNLFILAPVLLVMILDLIFTMTGQPDYYWQNHAFTNEGSPLGQIIMSANPVYFILFFVFYLVFVIVLVGLLPRPLNIMTGLGFLFGHIWGSSTWLGTIYEKLIGDYFTGNDWYLKIGYFIAIAIISGAFVDKWLKKKI